MGKDSPYGCCGLTETRTRGQLLLPASADTTWNNLDRRDSIDLHQSSMDSAHPGGFCQKHSLQKAMMAGFLPFPGRAALITTPLLASQARKMVQWKKAHVSWSPYDHHQVTTRQMRQFDLLREHELSSKLRKYFVEQQQKNSHISMNQSCLHLLPLRILKSQMV